MTITICASVDFTPKIIEIKKELETKGHSVNIPFYTQQILDGKSTYEEYMTAKDKGGDIEWRRAAEGIDFFKRYWDYIKNSDAILVLNLAKKGIENYIGGNTLIEMGFTKGMDKKIFLYNPIPVRSERMHYVDEIMDMDPIVVGRDLTMIDYD